MEAPQISSVAKDSHTTNRVVPSYGRRVSARSPEKVIKPLMKADAYHANKV